MVDGLFIKASVTSRLSQRKPSQELGSPESERASLSDSGKLPSPLHTLTG